MEAGPPLLPGQAALYLDFDGTLAELAPTPGPASSIELAARRCSPRCAAQLDGARRDPDRPPARGASTRSSRRSRFAGAGCTASELRPEPGKSRSSAANPWRTPHRWCGGSASDSGTTRACSIEDKDAARRAALPARARARGGMLARRCGPIAPPWLFDVIDGSEVVEARPRGADKGAALRRSVARSSRSPGGMPVCVGDDRTDEDGFRGSAASWRLRRQGRPRRDAPRAIGIGAGRRPCTAGSRRASRRWSGSAAR